MIDSGTNYELKGGRVGKIQKVKNTVVRPANVWTPTVHKFLRFINENGADFVPIPYKIDGDKEIISYIEGDVFNETLPDSFSKDNMIVSAAELLSKFHSFSQEYVKHIDNDCIWMLKPNYPIEIICYGDFAPYNTVIGNDRAIAMIDFDTIHPGSRLWDVSYGVYRWIPFTDEPNEKFEENMRRVRLFLDVYGMETESRKKLVNVLIKRLSSLIEFVKSESGAGNLDFQKNIEDGHLKKYIDDIQYLKLNEMKITNAII